jgi:hypothetical protein
MRFPAIGPFSFAAAQVEGAARPATSVPAAGTVGDPRRLAAS